MLLARDVELVTDCEQHHDSAKVPVSAECTCVRVELRRSTSLRQGGEERQLGRIRDYAQG